ncbi:tetratricopeptide repeat-containing protein [Mycena leptocephala]|nr:tetratricopeptide repeat-containing protein [Mycena leptocephala]
MDSDDLDVAIELDRAAKSLQTRFEQQGNAMDIEDAIELHREALGLRAPHHPDRGTSLNNLANAVQTRFEQHGNLKDVDEAIELHKEALAVFAPPHPNRSTSLNNLATALRTRFEQLGDSEDMDEAIELHREALTLGAPPHPHRSHFLNNLATAVHTRFMQRGDSKDIDEAIELHREALHLRVAPHPNRGASLNNLANAVRTRFEQHGDPNDIDEAVQLHREALALRAPPHPNCSDSLNNLAHALQIRFVQQGDSKDIDEAVELHREALALCSLPHPDHCTFLNNLASAIQTRFEYEGDSKDINEVIELHRKALNLLASLDPNRSTYLNNLANAVQRRFEQQGHSKDIEEAIGLYREALALGAPPPQTHTDFLNNLASAFQARFQQHGDTKDIDEAIALHREALHLRAAPHPDRGASLNNLANAVRTRFEQRGDQKDIDEAVQLHREALALRASPHPKRSSSLNNLASAIRTRFEQRGDSKDIDEAITLQREALALCTPPHRIHSLSLNNLAVAVQIRFVHRGDLKDIDEVIELHRKALALRPPPHPNRSDSLNNLAAAIQVRFEQQQDSKDIEEAIELHKAALALRAPPHPQYGSSLNALGLGLATKYVHSRCSDDLDQACALFQEATMYLASSPRTRFHHARSWASNADRYAHISALPAYHAAIKLLPQLAPLHLDLSSRQEILSTVQATSLASDAAACAVSLRQFHTAVEFLEASRSVFWSQALHLRTSLDDLATIHPEFAANLTELSRQLEQASFLDNSRNTLTDTQSKIISMESDGAHLRQLNTDWDNVIKSVRILPGFEDFMHTKGINVLKQAAVSGPIIILTATDSTCFALIVTSTNEVQCLQLPGLNQSIIILLATFSGALSTPAFDFNAFLGRYKDGNDPQVRSELVDRLFGTREGSKSCDPPRLWWCPTGPFAFLPLHAAGVYRKEITDCTSDYVVSSYAPTLTTLLDPPVDMATPFKLTAVIQPYTPGCGPLPGAQQELTKIGGRVPSQWLTPLVDTTIDTALIHLRESSIVHFACHGTQDLEHPLDSGLILRDGRLKVSEIMRRPDGALDVKKSMSLAFLSACETAKGDQTIPDEAMHLAATLLFGGFHGVVATMWAMNDLDGPKIADTFYGYLFRNCDPNSNPPVLPDLTQAAKALHLAVAKLREEPDVPFRHWVPFVHYGL